MSDWSTVLTVVTGVLAEASSSSNTSSAWFTVLTVITGVACLVIGYLAGYRSGIVAGELQALKSSLRHDSSRRHRDGGYEGSRSRSDVGGGSERSSRPD